MLVEHRHGALGGAALRRDLRPQRRGGIVRRLRQLAYATVAGAIKLAQASDDAPATLRAQVTSKGGTTERAVSLLDAHDVKAKFVEAVKAAAARATELGDELSR